MQALLFDTSNDADGRIAACLNAVSPAAPGVRALAYHDLLAAVITLDRELRSARAQLELLALVGHGGPGWLSAGRAPLTAGSEALRFLTYLKPSAVLHSGTRLQLLGCRVGASPDPAREPGAGDGELLALAVRRALGCVVEVAVEPIWSADFGPGGLAATAKLRRQVTDICCGLAPLT